MDIEWDAEWEYAKMFGGIFEGNMREQNRDQVSMLVAIRWENEIKY